MHFWATLEKHKNALAFSLIEKVMLNELNAMREIRNSCTANMKNTKNAQGEKMKKSRNMNIEIYMYVCMYVYIGKHLRRVYGSARATVVSPRASHCGVTGAR